MSTIKKVIVVGGSGNVGHAVVMALLEDGFKVSILSRQESRNRSQKDAAVVTSDFSAASLAEAFSGQDAVVSTIASGPGLFEQKKIIDAAVAAGVKRFIPSEFGGNTQNVASPQFAKLIKAKVDVIEHLRAVVSANSGFTWTGLSTGVLFELGIRAGILGFSVPTRSATIFDSGTARFSATTLAVVGLSVARILGDPGQTANRYLCVASFTTSQNEILRVLEEATNQKWTTAKQSADEALQAGWQSLAKGEPSGAVGILRGSLFKDGSKNFERSEDLANKMLGLPDVDLPTAVEGIAVG